MPLISVIMLTYNHEKYISEAIESILNQSFKDFELIVLDDGSTDNTGNIIKKYLSDSRVKYIYQENLGNKGFGIDKVINKAIELTNGKFICFAPGDDVSIPNRLELQINKFRLDPSIDIVFSDMWIIDEKSQVIAQKYLPEFSFTSNSFLRLLFKINLVTAPTVMMKRKCIEKVGLFEQGLVSDYHYWLKSAKVLNFKFIKTPLVKYRIHQKSLSRAPENRDFLVSETIRILKLMRKYYTIYDLYPEIRYCKDKNRALSDAYLDFGNILLTGNFPIPDLAIKEFTKSLKHHPNLAALNNLGIAMILDGKIKGGITFLNKALKQFGSNDKLLSNLNSATQMLDGILSSQFHLLTINSKESELKKTIDLYEQNPHHIEKKGYYYQAEALYNNGQETKAIKLFEKTLELDPNFALAHNDLACIYWQKRNIKKALHHITKAMELAPDNRDIIWNFGQILRGLGYAKNACKVYKDYLERHPGENEIRQVVEDLEKGQIF